MKTLKFITVLAVVLALTAFAVNVDIFSKEEADEMLNEGEVTSNFYLQDEDGKVISLAECSKAKGYILIFTAGENAFSTAYENEVIALNRKYKKMGYPVIVINPNLPTRNAEDAIAYTNKNQEEEYIRYLYLLDKGHKVYPNQSATQNPLVYVLQKKSSGFKVKYMGSIKQTHPPRIDEDDHDPIVSVDEKTKLNKAI